MNSYLYYLIEHYPLEKLLQVIPAGIFAVTPDQRIVYWSEGAERITGYTAAEVIGRSCLELHADNCCHDCALFDDETSKPLMGKSCSFVHKGGHRLSLSKNADLLRAADGRVVGGIEAIIDRTGLRDVELERDSLRSVLNSITDPIYICDRYYRLLFFNRAMDRLIGKMTDRPCYEVLYGRDDVCPDCPMDEVFAGELCRQETHLIGTGRIYEVLHSACHFYQQPECKLGICRDITERLAIRQRLQQVNRELDAFVSMVSHDLRSPLTPLIGYAELLQEHYSYNLDDLGRESISEIHSTAERMRDLLEDLLCLARVGQVPIPVEPVTTSRVVAEIVNELSESIARRGVQIDIGRLPDVMIPESLLADLYRNLLSNALKYGVGKQEARIEIFGHVVGSRIELLVRDHGVGVAETERETVFEPFVRGVVADKYSGTGIGLATVAKIARVYQGRVWIEETPGGGATFVVELPNPQQEY
ncbi:MAG: PAS domain S-box protein [Desulfuromonadales bacterium]|nr:PAS domain S-box protein [Desulfuromonadales bacterium]